MANSVTAVIRHFGETSDKGRIIQTEGNGEDVPSLKESTKEFSGFQATKTTIEEKQSGRTGASSYGKQTVMLATTQQGGKLPRPIMVSTQPVLLPKPRSQGQQLVKSSPIRGHLSTEIASGDSVMSSPGNSWSSSTGGSRKRRAEFDAELLEDRKKKRTPVRSNDKGGKGLRHFSMKVCEKVQQKQRTTYNEVADELVQEFSDPAKQISSTSDVSYDQKNIRRRVYDALNVLMAMNIISKEKKEIRWVGLPTNSAQECIHLEDQKKERLEKIKQKKLQLQELILQEIAFKNLVERNKECEKKSGTPDGNGAIQLPFIIVNTSKKTVIDCSISNDKTEYLFNFDNTFEIHDDIEVLKRMGMAMGLEKGKCDPNKLSLAKSMVPKALEPYVRQMAIGGNIESEITNIPSDRPKRPQSPSSPLATPIQAPSSPMASSASNRVNRGVSRASSVTSFTSESNRSGQRTHTPSPLPSFESGSESGNEVEEDESQDAFAESSNDA